MNKRYWLTVVVAASVAAGLAYAQFPVVDMLAGKVIDKYQAASCEQLWEKKGQPKSPEVQRAVGLLRSDPAMRTEFINRVAAPIANKMFECGMIP